MILILDDEELVLSSAKRNLELAGYTNVQTCGHLEHATRLCLQENGPDLTLIDIHLSVRDTRDGLDWLQEMRRSGYNGIAVIYSGDFDQTQVLRAGSSGADDFLVKDTNLDFVREVTRILETFDCIPGEPRKPRSISELAYLRHFGLTPKQLALLTDFSKNMSFPSFAQLALAIGQNEVVIRKQFSEIYKKLRVDDCAGLANRMVICKLLCKSS